MKPRYIALAWLLTIPLQAFDPAKDIGITVHQGKLTLEIPSGVHLKQRGFNIVLVSLPGRLKVGPWPPAMGQDEAGDPIWRGEVSVPLSGEDLGDPVELRVTFQPCTEGEAGECYLPQRRIVRTTVAELTKTTI